MSPTIIVAYLALFATVGFLFLLVSLLLGKFLRAQSPTPQKLEIYECGEPAVGPGSVQFDLRFYVVALLFLIFEVEVAFFFPPAVVFGKAVQGLKTRGPEGCAIRCDMGSPSPVSSRDVCTAKQGGVAKQGDAIGGVWSKETSESLALAAMCDMGVFFAVLLVGFAFLWRRGDLNWVRATHHPAIPAETAALAARLRQENIST